MDELYTRRRMKSVFSYLKSLFDSKVDKADEEAEIDEIKEDLTNNTTYTLDGENLVLFSLR